MELELVLDLLHEAVVSLRGRSLSDVEMSMLRGVWQGQTYGQIAETFGYSESYLGRDIGPKFWKMLSLALDETVGKKNIRAVMERRLQQQKPQVAAADPPTLLAHDWGAAPDVESFCGRESELQRLTGWLTPVGHCRLMVLLGMGGIGKSALAVKFAQQIQGAFDRVIWRSLQNSPSLDALLQDLLGVLDPRASVLTLSHLLRCLKRSRCLLILDNLESLLQPGKTEVYRSDCGDYEALFRLFAEVSHESLLVVTSREPLPESSVWEGDSLRSLQLAGSLEASLAVLRMKGVDGDRSEQLCDRYGCSPLALKWVAMSLHDLFDGDIAEFLAQETLVFRGLSKLLDQQFSRCSPLEQQVLYWLAIYREGIDLAQLTQAIYPPVPRRDLMEALKSLLWRSLIDRQGKQYRQQPVVMEFVTERLIQGICEDISAVSGTFLNRYALLIADAPVYLKEAQRRFIGQPIVARLRAELGDQLDPQVQSLLSSLRSSPVGYGAGNLLNLLIALSADLRAYDFSGLTVWQADLAGIPLQGVNFTNADLSRSLFSNALSAVLGVAMHPQGDRFATADVDHHIRLWGYGEMQQRQILKGHTNWVWSVDFSSDGLSLLSASEDGTLRVWDDQGNCTTVLTGHEGRVWHGIYHPDGQSAFSAGADHSIKVWHLGSGQCVQTLTGHTQDVHALCLEGRRLVSASADQTIRVWDLDSLACVQVLEGHEGWVCAISIQGHRLLSGGDDGVIRCWDLETGTCVQQYSGHRGRIWCLAWHQSLFASGGDDQVIRLWTMEGTVQVLRGHTARIWSLTFSPDGLTLMSGSEDQTVRLWDVLTGRCLKTIQGHTNWVCEVAFAGEQLLSAHEDHQVRVWDDASVPKLFQGHQGQVWSVAVNPLAEILVSCSEDATLRLWGLDGIGVGCLTGHQSRVWSVACSSDGRMVASGSGDRTIKLWDIHTQSCLQTLMGHQSRVWSVAFSPDGRMVASGSGDRTIKLWDIHTQSCLQTLTGHQSRVWSVAFSPDGRMVASGSGDHTIKLWQVETGQLIHTLEGHQNWVLGVTFAPNGDLWSSGGDGTLRHWDVATGHCLTIVSASAQLLWSIAISPDGRTLACGSDDAQVRLWDLPSQRWRSPLLGHRRWIWSVAFSGDGSMLASGSQDGTIRTWDVSTGEVCRVLTVDRLYEGMKISGVVGLSDPQISMLQALGAVVGQKT